MITELEKSEYKYILPLLESLPRDPMLHGVMEGNRSGHIFANRISDPSVALIWNNMEYAYLIGNSASVSSEMVEIIEQKILPSLDKDGLSFLSIFPDGISPADVQEAHLVSILGYSIGPFSICQDGCICRLFNTSALIFFSRNTLPIPPRPACLNRGNRRRQS